MPSRRSGRMRAPGLFLLAALVVAGCAAPGAPEAVTVPPPESTGAWAECASSSAQAMAFPLRIDAITDAGGRGPGIHRLDARTFLWVWASYEDTLRQDRVSRVNEVTADREPDGTIVLCTRVELLAPLTVDGERRTYDVGARITAQQGLPEAPLRVVVNWVAGCPCDPLPRGNATAEFA